MLEPKVFHDFVVVSELMEQICLIADELVKNVPDHDRDLVSLLHLRTDETFFVYQRSILGLPQVVIESRRGRRPGRSS